MFVCRKGSEDTFLKIIPINVVIWGDIEPGGKRISIIIYTFCGFQVLLQEG
jgi:hypothetical protein